MKDTTEQDIQSLLDRLKRLDDGRMAKVIAARFGLTDGFEYTLEEIGRSLGGLTRERIRQIEKRALQFLQRFAEEAGNDKLIPQLYEMRAAARNRRKDTPHRSLPHTHQHIPTMAQLSQLRHQVDTGQLELASLGIRI